MLKVDFFESGIGDTIVVTFPDGGLGLVDAHPSTANSRDAIQTIVSGKVVHFVCLTHPHRDHGLDLIPAIQTAPKIGQFWHTISDFLQFWDSIKDVDSFPSALRETALEMRKAHAEFCVDLFSLVEEQRIETDTLRADLEPREFAGVEVHCLAPEHSTQTQFFDAYRKRALGVKSEIPDVNQLSAVLALRYGKSTVLLGADALQKNWSEAVKRFRKRKLPKATLLKVPHHGASNALSGSSHPVGTYLDLCDKKLPAKAVLFAGDARHPNPRVFDAVKKHCNLMCLANGLAPSQRRNPLNLSLKDARLADSSFICNPHLSFQVDRDGNSTLLAGKQCSFCV